LAISHFLETGSQTSWSISSFVLLYSHLLCRNVVILSDSYNLGSNVLSSDT